MYEWYSDEERGAESTEERLRSYYGPALPEQPLASTSWQLLRSQLGAQPSSGRGARRRYLPPWWYARIRRSQILPPAILEGLYRIADEAHIAPPVVRCTFKTRLQMPILHISWLRGWAIRLILPHDYAVGPASTSSELDVLIASGLARYEQMRLPSYLLARLLLISAFPILLAAVIMGIVWWHTPLPILLVAGIGLCGLYAAFFWLLDLQARAMVRQADTLMVRWIGRERACRGLHALAARSHVPSRRRWNDLSLVERIQRICSSHVAQEEERYTLAR